MDGNQALNPKQQSMIPISFADIFIRYILDFQTRELVTISALASMTGTGGQKM